MADRVSRSSSSRSASSGRRKKKKKSKKSKGSTNLEDVHETATRTDIRTRKVKAKPHFLNLCFDLRRPKDGVHDIDKLTDVSHDPKNLPPESAERTRDAYRKSITGKELNLPDNIELPGTKRVELTPQPTLSSVSSSFHKQRDPALKRVDSTAKNQYDCDTCGWLSKRKTFRHPYFRTFVATFIATMNFLIYAEDPIAHSQVEAEIPILGKSISFILAQYPTDNDLALVIKIFMAFIFFLTGMIIGRQFIHHYLLRDYFGMKMFRRNKGTFMVMFWTNIIWLWIGAEIYSGIMRAADAPQYAITAGLSLTNETFMKIAASGTWMGDYLTAYMVIDMMLQDDEYPQWAEKARERYHGWLRVNLFWGITIALCTLVITLIATDGINWEEYGNDMSSTTEFGRAMLASIITLFDLLIVMQDWEFPTFSTNQSINLPGLFTYEIKITLPDWMDFFSVTVTGKWFNYGIIFIVMMLDSNMLKNQVLYVPGDFGQYTGPENHVYSIMNHTVLAEQQRCWLADDPCKDLFTFNVRQGELSGDLKLSAQYRGYSAWLMFWTAIPAMFGGALFFYLLYMENPKRHEQNKHLRGLPTASTKKLDEYKKWKQSNSQLTESKHDDEDEEEIIEPRQIGTDEANMPADVRNFYSSMNDVTLQEEQDAF